MGNDRRAGLRLRDRFVLLVAWLVTCGLVYLLGFYVGRGTQERRLGMEERIVRLPVTSKPPPEGQRPKSENELTFYDTLVSGRANDRRPDDAAPSPAPKPAGAPSGAPAVAPAVTTPKTPPPSAVTARASEPSPPPRPTPARAPATPSTGPAVHAAPPSPLAAAPAPRVVDQVSDSPHAVRPASAHPGAPAPAPPPVASAASGGGWTVLASPTHDREEAENLLLRLRDRGYDAALVRVTRDGDSWYRLRVGRYASSDQAAVVMRKLRDHEGVDHAFVANE